MKIVIPTNSRAGLDDTVAEHFGRPLTYTFINEAGEVIEIIDNTSRHQGGAGLPPEIMKKHGADVLLCQDIGPRAINLCEELGIDVYIGSGLTVVKEIFTAWQNHELKKAGVEDACEDHKH